MQNGVGKETHCCSENPLRWCFSERCLQTAPRGCPLRCQCVQASHTAAEGAFIVMQQRANAGRCWAARRAADVQKALEPGNPGPLLLAAAAGWQLVAVGGWLRLAVGG